MKEKSERLFDCERKYAQLVASRRDEIQKEVDRERTQLAEQFEEKSYTAKYFSEIDPYTKELEKIRIELNAIDNTKRRERIKATTNRTSPKNSFRIPHAVEIRRLPAIDLDRHENSLREFLFEEVLVTFSQVDAPSMDFIEIDGRYFINFEVVVEYNQNDLVFEEVKKNNNFILLKEQAAAKEIAKGLNETFSILLSKQEGESFVENVSKEEIARALIRLIPERERKLEEGNFLHGVVSTKYEEKFNAIFISLDRSLFNQVKKMKF